MQPPLVIKHGTSTAQVGMGIQQGMVTVPMSVNSSMPTSIPNVMTINKPGGQNVVVTTQNLGSAQPTIIPNVQILNMRPGTPNVSAQKSVATVSPRVVIGSPQVVGARAAAPGITLQTLQGLQPGQQGHLLLKTENGQYQLLRVGPAPAGGALPGPQPAALRLSVPPGGGVATATTSVAAPLQQQQQQQPQQPQQQPQSQPPTVTTQKPSDNTKEKCRNFLANLLDLSSKEPKSVECSVRTLIQELIDALVQPEEFCDRLERLLNASPQPCLIGFLKKSLPLLRQSLVSKELVIEGINAPPAHVAFPSAPLATHSMQMPNAMHNMVSEEEGGPILTALLPPAAPQSLQPKSSKSISVLQNIPIQTKINVNKVSAGGGANVGGAKAGGAKGYGARMAGPVGGVNSVLVPGKSLLRDKERRSAAAYDDKLPADDDINDVAAMGGVNLAEETQRILHSTDIIGTQIRSCKEEYLVEGSAMLTRVRAAVARSGLQDASGEVAALLTHAVHDRLKELIEKLAVIAQHRIDLLVKSDSAYEVTQDVKGQLKFLEELDRVERKRREDSEREMLLRAAKSRSKNEDPEQAKLKAKAKEMQRAELEELRQREANLTALQAIGVRKKPRLHEPPPPAAQPPGGRGQVALRSRLKRINMRDMVQLLEQEPRTARSLTLYRALL